MDLASAYVLHPLNCWVLDFECTAEGRGMRGSPEYYRLESGGEDLESERGQDLVANLVRNLVANLVRNSVANLVDI